MTTVHGLCARLLRDEALAAGLDPFAAAGHGGRPARDAARAHRRADAAPPRLRAATRPRCSASFIERIDRLKAELVTAEEYAAWAARSPRRRARAPSASASSRRSTAAHDRMLAERGTLDSGDLVLRAHALLRRGRRRARARRARSVRPRARRRLPGPRPAPGAAGRAARRRRRRA